MTSVMRCPVAHGGEDAFRRNHEQLILQNAGDAFVAIDEAGTVLEWNREAERIYGYPAGEALGRDIAELIIPPEYRDDHHRGIANYAANGRGAVAGKYIELEARHRSGRIFPIEMAFWGLHDGESWFFYSFGRDISERKEREAERDFRARHDPLTGVANRATALEYGATVRSRPDVPGLSVLLVAIDRFKMVRQVLGHEVSEAVLREVAGRITATVADSGLVARTGEDEFAVVMPRLGVDPVCRDTAQAIAAAMAEPLVIAGDTVDVAVSIAVICAADRDETVDELLRTAGAGMHMSRRAGGGRITPIDDDMRRELHRRLRVERELARAVDADELRLHYQPIIAADGAVVGVEALVRWQHPRRGLLAPGDFIDIAEETGLIVPIGDWVLAEAGRQAAQWREAGVGELGIGVNFSARQFGQARLAETVRTAMEAYGFDWKPIGLHMEVTESLVMADPEEAGRVLTELHDLGVGLSIDDFGTGYSSLAYLRSFPMDIVKIDRSFIIGVATDPVDTAIVRAIVELAHATGKTVLAEGIEDPAQHERLLELGVDAFQGYYFGRPQPAADITDRLVAQTRRV